ncbi:cypD [Scenedesmus sp. PABB004]|nr:cypD [Scenedesmus sp. PABB004]
MSGKCPALLAAAAAGAAAASAAGYVAYTAAARRVEYVVIWSEGAKTGVRLARVESLDDLRAAVEERLHVEEARLFLDQLDGKPELTSTEALRGAYADPAACLQGALLLVATAGGAALGAEAAAAPRLAPVPDGPRPLPVLGNFTAYLRGGQGHPAYNLAANVFAPERRAAWGDTVVLHLPNCAAGGDTFKEAPPGMVDWAVTTCDPEVVAELLERQPDFPKLWGREAIERALQDVAGNGLFTSSTLDHDWESAHGLLPRGFNQIRIKNYYPVMLDKTRSFAAAWAAVPQGGELCEINDWLTCMTADAVVKASMGLDMGNVEAKASGRPLHKFIEAFRYALKAAIGTATVKSEFGQLAAVNPFFDGKAALAAKKAAAVKAAQEVVNELLERTRKGEIGGSGSVLSAMLNDVSPGTGDYVRLCNIYGQVMNLMIAGHETTAATLAWTLYYVATHPEVEARALAEIEAVLGDRMEPRVDDVPKLFYLEACFREALRLHPAVGTVTRDVMHDTTLKGKWFVRKGQRVDINNVALQRREDQWGGKFGDPNKYNPDRFMPGAAEETGRHPNAFNPWGFGVRACIGSQFALWEAKTFLAMILRFFKLRVPEGFGVPLPSVADGGAAPTPHHLRLRIWKRKGALESLQAAASAASPAVAPAAGGAAPAAAGAAPAAAGAAADAGGHGTPLLVLYGSNGGTCEELASALASKAASAGFAATAASLDNALKAKLPGAKAVLVVTSTYNGTPPDNAAAFAKWLPAQAAGSLSSVNFAVFGVGNSQWAQTYQAFPQQVALQLARAGANQLLEMAVGDVDGNEWMDAFDDWTREVIKALLCSYGVEPPATYKAAAGEGGGDGKDRLHLRLLGADEPGTPATVADAIARLSAAHPDDAYAMLTVLENRELQGPKSDRSTRHVQLQLPPGPAGAYTAGDHLEVMGNNDTALVAAALKLLGLKGDERVEWTTNFEDGDGAARGLGGGQKLVIILTATTALTWLVDLAAVPTRRTIVALAEACPCPPEAAALKELADEATYKDKVGGQRLTLVELLSRFRSVPVNLGAIANMLPRMGPRYYSISSSPLARPGTASISVGRVAFTTPTGRPHKGAASATIAATPVGGALVGSVRRLSSSFRLPKDPATPVIMVGPGTGVAPMMGFLQERAALAAGGAALGPAHLFFGCRSAADDFIYRAELEGYAHSGVLAGLHVAFSRDGASKVYVQDLILQQGEALWALFERGAHVYVCGDARRMAPDVRSAFKEIAKTWGGRNGAAAESWMGGLVEAKRYLEDAQRRAATAHRALRDQPGQSAVAARPGRSAGPARTRSASRPVMPSRGGHALARHALALAAAALALLLASAPAGGVARGPRRGLLADGSNSRSLLVANAAPAVDCPAGSGVPAGGGGDCAPCKRGTWSAGGPDARCRGCPEGYNTPGEGETSAAACTDCRAGYGKPADSRVRTCEPCPPGAWRNSKPGGGIKPCHACPVLTTTPGPGAKSPAACNVTLALPDDPVASALLRGLLELELGAELIGRRGLGSWNPGTKPCTWSGVVCSRGAPRVVTWVSAYFRRPPTGRLPRAWGELGPGLESLYLSTDPGVSGGANLSDASWPTEWRSLTGLKNLALRGMGVTGPLSLAALLPPNLERVDIGGSRFTSLADDVTPGALPALTQLNFQQDDDHPIGGTLPASWGALPALQTLALTNLGLTGPLPEAGFHNLTNLILPHNALSGPLPGAGFPSLKNLALPFNALSGPLPAKLPANLVFLDLSHNQLTGRLDGWELWARGRSPSGDCVDDLNLSHNQLTGPLPEAPGAWHGMFLSDNALTSTLPAAWAKWTFPEGCGGGSVYPDLSNNQLRGPLPPEWGAWSEPMQATLGWLNLTGNPLNTMLPPEWGNITNLGSLDVRSCGLQGTFPAAAWAPLRLYALGISDNPGLSGCLPRAWLEHGTELVRPTCEVPGGCWGPGVPLTDLVSGAPLDQDPLRNTDITGLCAP